MRDRWSDRGTGLVGLRRYTWWSLTGTTGFVLVVLLGRRILTADLPAWAAVACLAALAVTTVASVVLLSRRLAGEPADDAEPDRLAPGWLLAGCGGAVVLGGILLPLGADGVWTVAPATMVAVVATLLPLRRRRVLVAVAATVAAALGGIVAWASGPEAGGRWLWATLFPAGLVVVSAACLLSMLWGWDVAARLERARRLSAELAVADERLRFAAELHDIQGHHLQVIALKAELAARLAEADPARAAEQMREVRQLAADALSDTRAVVQAYRRTTLDVEITNATRVLAAAGIDARLQVDPAAAGQRLSETGRNLLGLLVREATTNVLRHSQARRTDLDYRVEAGMARLRVSNDGAEVEPPGAGPGTGLDSLAERLAAAGGTLTREHDGDRFVVAASLPLEAGAGGRETG